MSGVESTVTAGQRWHFIVVVPDDDASVPTFEVTGAGAASGTMTLVEGSTCRYEAYVLTAAPGWYMCTVTVGADTLYLSCYAERVTAPDERPAVTDVQDYLRETSWTTEEIAAALDAEDADQRARCRTAPTYPASLFRALVRRAARSLAMQAVLLGLQDAEGFIARIPAWDVEIRRYENPYRKLPIG